MCAWRAGHPVAAHPLHARSQPAAAPLPTRVCPCRSSAALRLHPVYALALNLSTRSSSAPNPPPIPTLHLPSPPPYPTHPPGTPHRVSALPGSATGRRRRAPRSTAPAAAGPWTAACRGGREPGSGAAWGGVQVEQLGCGVVWWGGRQYTAPKANHTGMRQARMRLSVREEAVCLPFHHPLCMTPFLVSPLPHLPMVARRASLSSPSHGSWLPVAPRPAPAARSSAVSGRAASTSNTKAPRR